MAKCTKCEKVLMDNDVIYWKCPACQKMFRVNLSKLRDLYTQKQLNNEQASVKCPGCGALLDDGNEMLGYKCEECGNVIEGNLEYFASEKETGLEVVEFNKEKIFCRHCGKELEGDLNFCPNCGKPFAVEEEIRYCNSCGEKFGNDVEFCSKCGTKLVTMSGNNQSNLKRGIGNFQFSSKRAKIILASCVIAALMAVVGMIAIPEILVSPETLMSEGNYKKAYDKSKKDEKVNVLIENLISSICREAESGLKDPASFKLRDAWYETTGGKRVVLYISGNNSMGGTTSSYWLYTFDSDDNKYELLNVITDMEDEEYKSYDESEDTLEKLLNNVSRDAIRDISVDDNKMEQELLERINVLHSDDLLKNVELLEEIETIYPSGDSDEV